MCKPEDMMNARYKSPRKIYGNKFWTFENFGLCYLDFCFFKVTITFEKTEVFKKGWKFAHCTYFSNCIMKKHYFLLWTKETATVFPYFYLEIIFYSGEPFDYVVNFKFYLNIFIFLNLNTNQTSKEQYLIKKLLLISGLTVQRYFGSKISAL